MGLKRLRILYSLFLEYRKLQIATMTNDEILLHLKIGRQLYLKLFLNFLPSNEKREEVEKEILPAFHLNLMKCNYKIH